MYCSIHNDDGAQYTDNNAQYTDNNAQYTDIIVFSILTTYSAQYTVRT